MSVKNIHGQMGGGGVDPPMDGPKKSTTPMDHFRPSNRAKKKNLKVQLIKKNHI